EVSSVLFRKPVRDCCNGINRRRPIDAVVRFNGVDSICKYTVSWTSFTIRHRKEMRGGSGTD
ncbi:unnamed protein product, partial [Tenebrio molitor]